MNEIRKLINVEHKFFDTNTTSGTTQSGSVTYISGVPQGDNISEREGDSIKIQSFEICGEVIRNASSTDYDAVRVMIVRDLQNTGATPAGSDILETLGSSQSAFQHLDFLNSSDLNKRFTVVYDEIFNLDTYHLTHVFRFKTTHDCHVFYRGTGSAVSSAGNGSYFILCVNNQTTNLPSVAFSSRLRFTDN